MSRCLHIAAFALIGLFLASASSHTQSPIPSAEQSSPQPTFRIGVDTVRIDAVVTDHNGAIVSDLTASDFELRQDGKLQSIALAQFVGVDPSSGKTPVSLSGRAAPVGPLPEATPLSREDVQRSIAIVVDDLGLSFSDLVYARRGLHTFIDTRLQEHDMVALVRTSAPGGVLQPFTTDRRLLHAQVERIQWTNGWATGLGGETEPGSSLLKSSLPATGIDPLDFSALTATRRSQAAAGAFGALNMVVRAASEMPGRRVVVLVAGGFQPVVDSPRVRDPFERVIDSALRSGVVVYAVDARGLLTDRPLASESEPGRTSNRADESLAFLAEQTGGFAVLNNNDVGVGLGRISDDVKSYYVLGYTPPLGTFAKPGKTPSLHHLSLTVRRPGLKVRTRKVFLGVSDPPPPPTDLTPRGILSAAALSPFVVTQIPLRCAVLPRYTADGHAFARAILQIDARPLSFAATPAGSQTADVDVLGMAFDQDGTTVGQLSTAFTVGLPDAGAASLESGDGLVYVLNVPIAKAGAYQIRFAVRDRRSGALGSTGQFVSIEDVSHGAFALSGVVLTAASSPVTKLSADALDVQDVLQQQTRRRFSPGARLSYGYEIHNAHETVQATASVWHGQERVLTAAPDALTPPRDLASDFTVAGTLGLGLAIPSGHYVLQISATTPDPKHHKKPLVALQQVDFEIQ